MSLFSPEAQETGKKDCPVPLASPAVDPRFAPLLWLTLLSLDAPAVAAVWQLLFARCLRVQLGAAVILLLALVVWLIYVADRLLDSLKVPAQGQEALRHHFCRKHRRAFVSLSVVVFLMAAWVSLTRLDTRIFHHGLILMLVVGAYFLLIHSRGAGNQRRVPKEMLVGVLFGVGTCFPVWENLAARRVSLLAPFLLFTALCWMNCAAIEYSEWMRLRGRQSNPPHAWTSGLGRHFALAAALLAAIPLGLWFSGFNHASRPLFAAEALSAAAFLVLVKKGETLSSEQFRVLMDLALLTPILFFFFPRP
jgi:hypothetical protein